MKNKHAHLDVSFDIRADLRRKFLIPASGTGFHVRRAEYRKQARGLLKREYIIN